MPNLTHDTVEPIVLDNPHYANVQQYVVAVLVTVTLNCILQIPVRAAV